MKSLVVFLIVVSAFSVAKADGTVLFNNRIVTLYSSVLTHVWGPSTNDRSLRLTGNSAADMPSGSVDYADAGMSLIGAGGYTGHYGGSNTFAQLLAAPGINAPLMTLASSTTTTTFRTGPAAGDVWQVIATLPGVPDNAPSATIQMVSWDNFSGLYPTWNEASIAWQAGLIAAGKSDPINVYEIGGDVNLPPNLVGLTSFNLYFIPEPGAAGLALLGLGLAGLRARSKRNR